MNERDSEITRRCLKWCFAKAELAPAGLVGNQFNRSPNVALDAGT